MVKKIKDNEKQSDKILKNYVPQISKICFGFALLTSNNHYGIKQFSRIENKANAYEDLIKKFADWSSLNANEAKQRGKKLGLERIPYKQLNHSMQDVCDNTKIVSKDSNVCVFQFYNHNYRLICKEDMIHSNVMHIIAFDLDFSAYDHG